MTTYLQLLRSNRSLTLLWLAQVISLMGDWFSTIVLSVLVVKYNPENSGLAVSGLLMARFIPPMLVSPLAGVIVDRFDRKRLMIASDLLRGSVVLLFLLAVGNPDRVWLIYVLSMAQFTLSAVFQPAQSSMIPNLVPQEQLVIANTLMSVTWSVMLAVGAVIGGLVGALFGIEVALVIDAATFLLAALLVVPITGYKGKAKAADAPGPEPGNRTFAEGIRFLRRTPGVAAVLMVKFGSSLGNVDTLMTIYATQLFALNLGNDVDGGQLTLGIMYSAFGLGAVLGPVILNQFSDGSVFTLRRMITLGFIGICLAWVGMGIAESLLVACLALVLRAMGGSVNWTYSSVLIQKSTPDAYLGRVFSMDMAAFYLATVASTLIHGSLIDAVGAQNARQVALATVLAGLVPLVVWSFLVRWLARRESAQFTELRHGLDGQSS